MSLTSELNNPQSKVSLFFSKNFSFDNYINTVNTEIRNAHTLAPKIKKDYPWADVGHMVEYLMLLHMGLKINELFPLKYAKDTYLKFSQEMNCKYANQQQYFTSKEKFCDLCNDLYKLSHIEEGIRKGMIIPTLFLNSLRVNQNICDDIINVYFKSLKVNSVINDQKNNFCYNPTFELSKVVGGADADLYLINPSGNTLLDLKTTIRPTLTKDMIHQLLGYVFLDKSDQHNITDIGIYLTRQNLISNWNVNEIITANSKFKNKNEAKFIFINSIT